MAINERLIDTKVADAGDGGAAAEAEQGLILHLDANDVDSYDGDGSIWYDISEHDVTIPLSDNADDLELHLNASDATSYDPTTGTTTWNDISGNARNATLTSMGNSSFDIDNGGFFDVVSTSDYVTIPYNAALVPTSTGYTFEGWYNFDIQVGGTNWSSIFGNWDESGAADGFLIRFKAANIELFIYENGNSLFASASNSTSISTNEWFHVAFTLSTNASGGLVKVYVNGELKINGSLSGTYNPNSSQDLFMCYGGDIDIPTSRYFDGKVGAGRIYSKALSASEVGQNYRHGRDYIYTDLVDDTDLELHLDAADFDGSTNTPATWTDKTSNSNNGSISGATFDAELGNWLDLERDSSHNITIADSSSLDISTNITLEAWINPESNTSYGRLFWKSGAYALYLGTNGWTFLLGSTSLNHNSGIPSTGTWYHIVATYDGSNQKLYINGELVDTESMTGSIPTNNNPLYIGGIDSARFFDGKIGQVRLYSTALTADEVMQNYLFTKNDYPNTNHATGNNMDSSDWNSGGYFDFDGSSEYFTTGDLGINSSTLTMSAWVNLDTYSTRAIMMLGSQAGNAGKAILFRTQDSGKLAVYDGSAVYTTSSVVLTLDTWHHVALAVNGTSYEFFVDGSSEGSATALEYSGDDTLDIGYYGLGNSQHWDGFIGSIKIYNKTLTSSEILADYNATESTY
jgi:hypothetical protein